MNTIRWLHISDLHFGNDTSSRKTIRKSLIDFVKKQKFEVDYLFVTGDLIFAKELKTDTDREKAYKDAYAYLAELYKVIWKEPTTENMWKRVFIVPGNHDVIRSASRNSKIKGILENYIDNGYNDIDSSFDADYSDGIKMYLSTVPEERKIAQPESISAKHYVVTTEKVNILHLNSCMTSGKDKEEGTLILGSAMLEKTITEIDNDKPIIAISHHNIDYLDRDEQKRIEFLLKKHNIYLFLCGHTHARESNIILHYDQSRVLYTFTAGTLMNDSVTSDVVILNGELNFENNEGVVHSYKWSNNYSWHSDDEFGLAQSENQGNFRYIRSEIVSSPYFSMINENLDEEKKGINSIIVSHTAPERDRAFADVNENAKSSLSVFGIGITHVSQNKELMSRILESKGSVRLCMMDPTVFKEKKCDHLVIADQSLSSMHIKVENCDIDKMNFCIGASHINSYIRDAYADEVRLSFERIKRFKEEISGKGYDFSIRLLRSFVPISINIINEKDANAQLIAEYNMPFVEKRLLLQANKEKNEVYYTNLVEVFEKIWEKAVEVD